jgi:hypothetical protein
MVFRHFVHFRYFSLKSTGTVKIGLPTQILKNPFNTLKSLYWSKNAQNIFQKDPQICFFLGEKSPMLATLV